MRRYMTGRIAMTAVIIGMLATSITAGATDWKNSKGVISYGEDIVFDSSDLDKLNTNYNQLLADYNTLNAGLSSLTNASIQHKDDIVSKLSAAGILADTGTYTWDQLITSLDAIPSPTNAIAKYTTGTGTGLSTAPGTGITGISHSYTQENQENEIQLALTGSTPTISLDVDQSIILPAGYYNKPIIIKNAVKNMGSSPLLFAKADVDAGGKAVPAGYYDEGTIIQSSGNLSSIPNATISYIHHIHSTVSADETETTNSPDPTSISTLTYADRKDTSSGCYTKIIYHSHTGNSNTGGGCYGTPIKHYHTGSASSGGGCYGTTYHSHSDSCYYRVSQWHSTTSSSSVVPQYVTIYSALICNKCGDYDDRYIHNVDDYCWKCSGGRYEMVRNYQKYSHDHTVVTYTCTYCGKTAISVSCSMDCGPAYDGTGHTYTHCCPDSLAKWDNDSSPSGECVKRYSTPQCGIDSGYPLICGKTNGQIIGYEANCGLEGTVDHYELGCGKSQGQLVTAMIHYE